MRQWIEGLGSTKSTTIAAHAASKKIARAVSEWLLRTVTTLTCFFKHDANLDVEYYITKTPKISSNANRAVLSNPAFQDIFLYILEVR